MKKLIIKLLRYMSDESKKLFKLFDKWAVAYGCHGRANINSAFYHKYYETQIGLIKRINNLEKEIKVLRIINNKKVGVKPHQLRR